MFAKKRRKSRNSTHRFMKVVESIDTVESFITCDYSSVVRLCTRQIEWRNKTNEVKNFFDFSGVYSSGTTADPSLIVEFAYDNGYELGESE